MPPPKLYHKSVMVKITTEMSNFLEGKKEKYNYNPSDLIRDLITNEMKR